MPKKIKICFIIPSLRAGGAERVMSFLAENIDKNYFTSELLVIGSEKDKSYDISTIPVTFLNKQQVRKGVFSIYHHLKKNNTDVAVSAISHLNIVMSFLSLFFPKTKFVGRETIVRTGLLSYQKKKSKSKIKSRLLSSFQAWKLDAIICQSNDMKNDLQHNYGYPEKKLVVLNNPISKKFELKNNTTPGEVKEFITVGRLSPQKGYLRILKVLTHYKFPYHYTIIGSGDEQQAIFDFISKNSLQQNITHIPFTKNVEKHLKKSDIYLQGSFVEGFPNALLESCAVGTPVLAFDALGGINEIIQEGINGYIANDDDDFLKKLELATQKTWNPALINQSVTSRYSESIILKKYADFFKTLVKVDFN